jgi:hypothetical protein
MQIGMARRDMVAFNDARSSSWTPVAIGSDVQCTQSNPAACVGGARVASMISLLGSTSCWQDDPLPHHKPNSARMIAISTTNYLAGHESGKFPGLQCPDPAHGG